jgi:hypothetical protein
MNAASDSDSHLQVHKTGIVTKIWHDPVWSKVIASVIVACSFAGGTWFGNWFALTRQSRIIKFVEEVPTPGAGPGWQDVTLAVEPPPSAGERVQVWIKQGNFSWYRCSKATQLADGRNWKATCRFGNRDSKNPNDWAKPGQDWFAYGVFCSRDLKNVEIRDELPDRNISWQAQLLKVAQVEPTVLGAVYRGK